MTSTRPEQARLSMASWNTPSPPERQVAFDRPRAGRAWFEQTIRDQLDLGQPGKVQIVFARKITGTTPGVFQTKVITRGVQPVIQAHYKHSKVKLYFKEGRALRTETTVNDPNDFGVGRALNAENWRQLTMLGHDINQPPLQAKLQASNCAPEDPSTLQRLVSPSIEDGQPAPALHFGDPRVMALLASLCSFQHLFQRLTNHTLRPQIAEQTDRRHPVLSAAICCGSRVSSEATSGSCRPETRRSPCASPRA
jgi:hypothetical protein